MTQSHPDSVIDAFFALHHNLPRQGPGSDETTRHLLRLTNHGRPRPRAMQQNERPPGSTCPDYEAVGVCRYRHTGKAMGGLVVRKTTVYRTPQPWTMYWWSSAVLYCVPAGEVLEVLA